MLERNNRWRKNKKKWEINLRLVAHGIRTIVSRIARSKNGEVTRVSRSRRKKREARLKFRARRSNVSRSWKCARNATMTRIKRSRGESRITGRDIDAGSVQVAPFV